MLSGMGVSGRIVMGTAVKLESEQLSELDKYLERTEEDIIDDLTINHANKFVTGTDTSKLELLKLIVAFIDTPSGIFQDDIYSTSSGLDLTECKDVFKTIFEALGQEQHYNQMMKSATETEKAAS